MMREAGRMPLASICLTTSSSASVDPKMGTPRSFMRMWEPLSSRMPTGRNSASALDSSSRRTVSRSEEHTSELQSLMRISYAVFCLKKKKNNYINEYSDKQHKISPTIQQPYHLLSNQPH